MYVLSAWESMYFLGSPGRGAEQFCRKILAFRAPGLGKHLFLHASQPQRGKACNLPCFPMPGVGKQIFLHASQAPAWRSVYCNVLPQERRGKFNCQIHAFRPRGVGTRVSCFPSPSVGKHFFPSLFVVSWREMIYRVCKQDCCLYLW